MKLMEVATERFIDNITSITPGALKGGLNAVDRHPTENQLLIGGADGVPKTYKMFREQDRKIGDDFNLLKKYPELPGRIFDVSYSKDGKQIVACSSLDGAGYVRVFDTESTNQVADLADLQSSVYCVAFSPDGQWVVSGDYLGNVCLHEAATGKLKSRFIPVDLQTAAVAN
ncbi:MAG: hypothetical protein KDA92_14175 [Planctomycetales bacterium]|nr:hypothetical protein [Planctomycetales bacterium]